jgi:hypothetical protein
MLVSDNILGKNVGSQFSGPFMFFSTVKYEKDSCKCCEQTDKIVIIYPYAHTYTIIKRQDVRIDSECTRLTKTT